jgi:hypothetical protein
MEISRKRIESVPEEGYEITINTFTGDDDYSSQFSITVSEEELPKYIIALEVIGNSYKHGRGGGCDHYTGPYWDLFEDSQWNLDGEYEQHDTLDYYEVRYNDGKGVSYEVTTTLSKEEQTEVDTSTAEDR